MISTKLFQGNKNLIFYEFFSLVPIYFVALCEDIFGEIKIYIRLLASFTTAAILVIYFSIVVNNLDFPIIDRLFSFVVISSGFTIIGMVATSNAWNFIDGVNGLSSGIAFFVLLALSKLANDIGMLAHSNFFNFIICSIGVLDG